MPTSTARSSSDCKTHDHKQSTSKGSNPAVAEQQQLESADKKRKFGEEIDDIFESLRNGSKKKKESNSNNKKDAEAHDNNNNNNNTNNKKDKKGKAKSPGKKRSGKDDDPERRKNRKRTEDGLAIYSAKELGINNPNAGGAPSCPFDCDCCF